VAALLGLSEARCLITECGVRIAGVLHRRLDIGFRASAYQARWFGMFTCLRSIWYRIQKGVMRSEVKSPELQALVFCRPDLGSIPGGDHQMLTDQSHKLFIHQH
jgi:hypothetical protein